MAEVQPYAHKPVVLLKINKLGILGGKRVRASGVANAMSALLSRSGVNVGRGGTGERVSKLEEGA